MNTETRDLVVVTWHQPRIVVRWPDHRPGRHDCGPAGLDLPHHAGVDIVRRSASDMTHVRPLEPLADMLRDFLARGGTLWACTPCVKSRGYTQENLLDGVAIAGSSVMHELIKRGAATLSF